MSQLAPKTFSTFYQFSGRFSLTLQHPGFFGFPDFYFQHGQK
jgi:hypothetical protein